MSATRTPSVIGLLRGAWFRKNRCEGTDNNYTSKQTPLPYHSLQCFPRSATLAWTQHRQADLSMYWLECNELVFSLAWTCYSVWLYRRKGYFIDHTILTDDYMEDNPNYYKSVLLEVSMVDFALKRLRCCLKDMKERGNPLLRSMTSEPHKMTPSNE